ncbi:MAG: ATP-binding protein [Candidatus Cloacimonadaceae bacterium]|nr:ATP-binding protein [Candidatus Cloacimonadaceae bacterium]
MNSNEFLCPVNILHKVMIMNDPESFPDARHEIGNKRRKAPLPSQTTPKQVSQGKLSKEISPLISHPEFVEYQLTKMDVLCIAILWKKHIECMGTSMSWNALCRELQMNVYDTNTCLAYIESLLDRKLITFDETIKSDYHINPIILLSGEFMLSNLLIMKILGRSIPNEIGRLIAHDWLSDSDFISDLNQCMNTIFSCFGEIEGNRRRRSKSIQADVFFLCIEPLLLKLGQAPNELVITKLINDHKLDKIEICILILVLYTQLTQDNCITENELLGIICNSDQEISCYSRYLKPDSKLIAQCLLQVEEVRSFANRREFSIPEELKLGLCGEQKSVIKPQINYYLSQNNALKLVKVEQSIDDLILPKHDKSLLMSLTHRYKQLDCQDFANWGLNIGHNSQKGMIALFYGKPGTGKTYAAGAVANALLKPLVGLDCSALRDSYYGESEKLVKNSFDLMHKMSVEMDNPPVFLINEADQLVHNRSERNSYGSRTDNSIQNIILEAMESFPGIMILTTNLDENIDEAYFRRFNLKLKFNPPDLPCRIMLWKLHASKDIPGATDIDIEYLAKTYEFTGGQIALVVNNACSEAITRSGKFKRLTMADIVKYAALEQPWAGNNSTKIIGF